MVKKLIKKGEYFMVKIILDIILIIICIFFEQFMEFTYNHSFLKRKPLPESLFGKILFYVIARTFLFVAAIIDILCELKIIK